MFAAGDLVEVSPSQTVLEGRVGAYRPLLTLLFPMKVLMGPHRISEPVRQMHKMSEPARQKHENTFEQISQKGNVGMGGKQAGNIYIFFSKLKDTRVNR
jgi:hypothetical protein